MGKHRSSKDPEDLRMKAEENLEFEPDRLSEMSLEEVNGLLHELRVHQVELEMQNEELSRLRSDLEISRSRYADLYDFAPVGYLTLNKHGRIVGLNLTAAMNLGVERGRLINSYFQNCVFLEDKNEFLSHLIAIFERRERQISEVRLSSKTGGQFYAQLESIYVEEDDGTGLCRTIMSDVSMRRLAEQERRESEEKYRGLAESIPGMVFQFVQHKNGSFSIPYVNGRIMEYAGISPEAVMAEPSLIFSPIHPDDQVMVKQSLAVSAQTLQSFSVEHRVIDVNGQIRWFRVESMPQRLSNGDIFWNGVSLEITDRKRAELELRESENRYRKLFEEAIEGIILADAETGEIIDCNQAFLQLSEYKRPELVGKPQIVLHPIEEGNPALSNTFLQHRGQGEGSVLPSELVTGSGTVKQVEIKANVLEIGGRKILQGFFRDVTSESRLQRERETTLKLLNLLDESNGTRELMRELTGFIKIWTGCEAVGIRLRSGRDFPYYETRGFPQEFVESENSLCTCGDDGKVVLDFQGNPVLECMCGNIVSARFNPALPFFTQQGSFWTNSTTELLASTGEEERQARTRNRCNGEGYESVALIPLRHGGETYGLLQVNDRAKNRFTPDLIEFLERTCVQIATELSQRQSKAELLESEQQFRRAILASPFPVIIHAEDGQVIAINEVWTELSGYTLENIPTISVWSQKAFGKEQNVAKAEFDKLYGMESRVENGEYVIATKNGGMRIWDFSSAPLGMTADGRRLIISVAKDVTERKEAENALRQSEDKYRLFVETASEWVWALDARQHVTFVNQVMCDMLGYGKEEVIGKPVSDFIFEDQLEDHLPRMEARKKGHGERYERKFRCKNGEALWVIVSAKALMDKDGGFQGSFAMGSDITERKRLEGQLRQAHKLESIGTLAGGIAHDFNNILAIIMGYTEMLLLKKDEGSEEHSQLDEVFKAAMRAKNLVQQILAFSRRSEENKQPLQAGLIVKEASRMLRAALPSTIELKMNVTSSAVVLADPTQLHQVLMNLCTNAAHAMQENGGILEVSLTDTLLKPEDIPYFPVLQPGPYVKLTVKDTGTGMSSAILDRIFDPFFTTKEKGVGTGLGLAVVHGIVKSHGGSIEVSSLPGKGTTFHVFLPGMKKAPVTEAAVPTPIPRGRERILVVDDEPALAKAVKRMLERLGYKVDFRPNGVEALEAFRNQPPKERFDLVITDMTMPHLTGIDLAKELLKLDPKVAIILCTGFSEKADDDKAGRIGIRGFLMKPVVLRELAEMVRKVLDAKIK